MAAEVPKVSPYLLERGPEMCPRRLLCEYEERDKNRDVFTRWRLREPFVEASRLAHHVMATPDPRAFVPRVDFIEEEQRLFSRAVQTYLACFGREAARTVEDHGADAPTLSRARNVRIGGAIDLVVVLADGQAELRQFDFWGRHPCADPLASFAMTVAVLRLARWAKGRSLRICHLDLIGGEKDSAVFDYSRDLDAARARFDGRLDLIRARMDARATLVGLGCGTCSFVAGCPPHRQRGQ